MNTLFAYTSILRCVAISSDGKHIVSGSYEKTINIWKKRKGYCMNTIMGNPANGLILKISSNYLKIYLPFKQA